MKRIILCVLGCLLLLWTGAAAEDCPHEERVRLGVLNECKDVGDGHQMTETRIQVCDACGEKRFMTDSGDVEGHTFHMSESIHFAAENRHLCVFICPACWHITVEEYPCTGGEVCSIFRPEAGEIPPVQQGKYLKEYHRLTTHDYIKRWLAQARDV